MNVYYVPQARTVLAVQNIGTCIATASFVVMSIQGVRCQLVLSP